MRATAIGAAALAAVALVATGAGAVDSPGTCAPGGRPWLRVSLAGDGFDAALEEKTLAQLGADLGGQRLALCGASNAPASPPPLAEVTLTLSSATVLSIEVADSVTDKRMARQIRLATVPRDALALSIALAAQELLHASWIEAALAPPPEPLPPVGMHPVPAEVREINDQAPVLRTPAPERASRAWIDAALLAAGEHSTGGQTSLGGDLRFSAGTRFAVAGQFGLRAAPDVASAHGVVRGRQVRGGLGLGYLLAPRDAVWGGEVDVRADLVDVQFSGAASAGAQGASGSVLGALLSAYIGMWWRLGGPWRVVAEGGAGAPLRGVTASDEGATATGLSGFTAGLALGIGVDLGP
jgi:hypothetical protein